jgi:hypothetical protein
VAKRQPKTSTTEAAALDNVERSKKPAKWMLTKYACGHVGTEIGVKAKAFVRWAELRMNTFEEEPVKKCPDCK